LIDFGSPVQRAVILPIFGVSVTLFLFSVGAAQGPPFTSNNNFSTSSAAKFVSGQGSRQRRGQRGSRYPLAHSPASMCSVPKVHQVTPDP